MCVGVCIKSFMHSMGEFIRTDHQHDLTGKDLSDFLNSRTLHLICQILPSFQDSDFLSTQLVLLLNVFYIYIYFNFRILNLLLFVMLTFFYLCICDMTDPSAKVVPGLLGVQDTGGLNGQLRHADFIHKNDSSQALIFTCYSCNEVHLV